MGNSRQAVGGLKDHPISSSGRLGGLHTTRVGLWRAGAGVECARKRRACGARRRNRAPLLLLVGFGLLRFHCLPPCTASVWLRAGVWPVSVRASTITLVVASSSIDRAAQPNHGPLLHPHINKQSNPNWPRFLLIGSDTLCLPSRAPSMAAEGPLIETPHSIDFRSTPIGVLARRVLNRSGGVRN